MRPSEKEQEYFLRREAERLKKLRDEHREKLAAEEKERLRELHFMRCPKCGMAMTTSVLSDVEIDVCPDCKGIYLDAGELDKLLQESRRSRVVETIQSVRKLLRT